MGEIEYEGVVGRTLEESTSWWPELASAPDGAPDVVTQYDEPVACGVEGFSVGHQRGAAVCDADETPFAIDHDVLQRVVIDGVGPAYRNPAGEARVAAGRQ